MLRLKSFQSLIISGILRKLICFEKNSKKQKNEKVSVLGDLMYMQASTNFSWSLSYDNC